MRLVAPLVNDVSYVSRINHESHFAWQVQYLDEFGEVGMSLFVAGAAFGDVAMSFFVAGTAFGEIWVDSRSAKCCNFQYKTCLRSSTSNLGERAGAR